MRYRRRHNHAWVVIALLIFVGSRCRDNNAPPRTGRTAEAPVRDLEEIEKALVPERAAEAREGVAAAIVIENPTRSNARKSSSRASSTGFAPRRCPFSPRRVARARRVVHAH